jgi:hypothetical protein
LPAGAFWEAAAGGGHLVRALAPTGRHIIASDRFPQDSSVLLRCFLTGSVPLGAPIAVTNPPYSQLDAFLSRGLQLLDTGQISGLVLLLRHDHLQAATRIDALNRAAIVRHCNWRPRWIKGSTGNARWSFTWCGWLPGHHGPRDVLHVAEPKRTAQGNLELGETS